MSSLNKVLLIGRLGKDPEMRYMPSGEAVCNFSLATSETWKDKASGEKREKSEWHNIVMFGKLAEIAGQYLQKGALVYVSGKLTTEKYTNNGVERYTTKIIADEMKMLGGKSNNDHSGSDHRESSTPPNPPKARPSQAQQDDDDTPW